MASRARVTALGGMAIAVAVAVAIALTVDDAAYTIRAQFTNAGQLVEGSPVQVGGAPVGSVEAIDLTADGQAEVTMAITAGELEPLHSGTSATIRTIGLSGVANRFVELTPGPESAAEIPDGGVLDQAETQAMVDIDALLSSLDPRTRDRVQRFLRNAARINAGTADDLNAGLAYLNPAISQTGELSAELTRDTAAVEALIAGSSDLVGALSRRRDELERALESTASTLGAIARERDSLAAGLDAAPRALGRASDTLTRAGDTIATVRPVIREAQPLAPPLARVLRGLGPATEEAAPVVTELSELLPLARRALEPIPDLADSAEPAFASTASAVRDATPIFAGLRPYSPDLVAGLFSTLGASTMGYYDANSHYLRAMITTPGNPGLQGPIYDLKAPGIFEPRTGLFARCPGGAAEPAVDESNPWIPDPSTCDPEDNHR